MSFRIETQEEQITRLTMLLKRTYGRIKDVPDPSARRAAGEIQAELKRLQRERDSSSARAAV